MSLIKKELTEKSGFTMEFSVSKEAFDKAENEAYRKNVKSMNVPGFRKGKAPKSIIERMYGKGVFFEDAINACIPDAFEEAVKEAELQVVGMPKFDIVSADGDIILKAEGFVKPEVTIDGYKGIEAEKKVAPVTDEEVDAEVERARERNARTIEITDRAAENGDICNIDYEGSVDGVAFDGGAAKGHDLKLGSGSFIPGFEEQIVGKNIGEEFDVNVTFPEDYGAKELAGKPAVFKVKLHEIKVKELPTVDDEFAKDVSEFDTLKELKADIKKKALERKQRAADEAVENELVQQIVDSIKGEIPEAMFENRLEQCVEDFAYRLQSQGLNLETYLKYTGSTIEDFKKSFRPQAEMQVKYRLALEKIVELEAITPDEKDMEAEYAKLAENYGVELEKVKASIPAEELAKDVAVGKAIDLVKESAVITEVDEKAKEKAPAKKTAKKNKEEETEKAE